MAGVYIHIPFCKRKCIYCDFFSVAFSEESASRYAGCLIREFDTRRGELRGEALRTLYIGGGTPSLMPIGLIGKVARHIAGDCRGLEEFTVEVNPDDITSDYARELRKIGCNRVSMGVQSFDDNELRLLDRRHDSEEAIDAIRMLREAGFGNISIDLIYGIPGQTMDSWKRSVAKAIESGVEHISAYNLTYEEGTRLFAMRAKGRISEADDDLCVDMFSVLVDMLHEAGYEQYEISNFSRPGWHSRHNSSYWNFTPYLGLGASAHSFDGTVRRYNPSNLKRYMEAIESRGIAFEEEEESISQLYNEWVMTRLRTRDGLDVDDLESRFGKNYHDEAVAVLQRYVTDGCVEFDGRRAVLTKKGVMLSDMVFRDLFVV